jgi:O-antigen/teichoic acid export membrane protein
MSLSQNVLKTYASQLIQVLCSFACSLIAVRLLGKIGQGELALYAQLTAVGVIVFGFSLPATLSYFVSSQKIKLEGLFVYAFIFIIIAIGLAFLMMISLNFSHAGQVILPNFLSNHVWQLFFLLHLFLLLLNALFAAVLQSQSRFSSVAYANSLAAVAQLVFYVIVFFTLHQSSNSINVKSIEWIAFCIFLAQFFLCLFFYVQIRKSYPVFFELRPIPNHDMAMIMRTSAIYCITNFIQFLSYKMDVWFIHYYHHDKGMIGVYSIGVMLVQLIWLLPQALHQVLFIKIANASTTFDKWQLTFTQMKIIVFYGLLAMVGVFLCVDIFVPFVYGVGFMQSATIMKILVVGIVVFAISMPISAYFAGINQVRINFFASFLGFVVCLMGNFFLIPKYHVLGAAWASVFSYLIGAGYLFFIFFFKLNTKRIF